MKLLSKVVLPLFLMVLFVGCDVGGTIDDPLYVGTWVTSGNYTIVLVKNRHGMMNTLLTNLPLYTKQVIQREDMK